MAGKRILIFTNHFYPENFKINDVAFELAKKGHAITVLTGIPDYPLGKYYGGYGLFRKRKEIIKGIEVNRIPHIPRGGGKSLRLTVHYFSYALMLSVKAFFLSFREKYDIVLVHHTSPVFLGLPAVLYKKKNNAKLYFWDLDLWPESVSAAGNINNRFILGALSKIVKFIYRNSDKVLIGSRSFYKPVNAKGVNECDIVYFPNWAENILEADNTVESSFMQNFNANSFKVVFAGNIGEAQDAENILEAIRIVSSKKKNIEWIFIGDGRKLSWLKGAVEENNLNSSVHFLGRQPIEKMPGFFRAADAMLVTLKDEPVFSLTVPAKVQAYMASGKPIAAMINGEGAAIINEAECGLACNAGDYNKLAENVIRLAELPVEELKIIGENSYKYYKANFEKQDTLNKLFKLIEE